MKAIILARVSTEEQMSEGQSIPAQLARAREYASRKDLEIQSEHKFDESSTKDQRKKFEQVVEEIKKAKEKVALIVETVDRLQRSFRESVLLDELRKEGRLDIHFIRENLVIHKDSNSSEITRWDMAVLVAKSYVLQISDNVKRTFELKIRNGELPHKAPIGYLNTADEKGGKMIKPDPAKAHLVVKIFELYAVGTYSMATVAKMVGEMGLKSSTKTPKMLKLRQIEAILKNPFYYGQMLYKGQLYPHKYEPLISYDLWQKCKEVRESYKKKPTKHASKPFILKGLIKCKKCGCAITPEIQKGKYIYYRCTNYKEICKRVWIREEELLEPIKKMLKNLALPQKDIDDITKDLRTVEQSKNEFHQKALAGLRVEYDKVDNRIKVMYEDRLDGRITPDMYDNKLKEYKEKQQKLTIEMSKYQRANQNYYLTANKVLSLAQRAYEVFEGSEVEEKRQFLNFLLQNCQLDGRKLVFFLKSPFNSLFSYNTKHPAEGQSALRGGYWELNPG